MELQLSLKLSGTYFNDTALVTSPHADDEGYAASGVTGEGFPDGFRTAPGKPSPLLMVVCGNSTLNRSFIS